MAGARKPSTACSKHASQPIGCTRHTCQPACAHCPALACLCPCTCRSDLASVFVQLFEDDALAFACFERLMRSARRNFRHDETGIRWGQAGYVGQPAHV